jgi:hypothetical protein
MYGKLQSLEVRAGESIPAQPHFTPEFAEPGSGSTSAPRLWYIFPKSSHQLNQEREQVAS